MPNNLVIARVSRHQHSVRYMHDKLEINMHHLQKAMQYRQAPWPILRKICFLLIYS